MSSVVIYHNPRCSKSRAACLLIEEKGMPYTCVEYLNTPPSRSELDILRTQLGLDSFRDMIRRKEPEYKEQGLDQDALTEQELCQALARTPRLLERPIVVYQQKAVIARPPELALEILT